MDDVNFYHMLIAAVKSPHILYGALAACGSVTRFLWDCLRGISVLALTTFLAYIIFGFFSGNLVYAFLPRDFEWTDGVVLLAGFVIKELLNSLQHHGAGLLMRTLKIHPPDKDNKTKSKESQNRRKGDK